MLKGSTSSNRIFFMDHRTIIELWTNHGRKQEYFSCSLVRIFYHEISHSRITPLSCKVTATQNFPQPISLRIVVEFLGFVNAYHRCILLCTEIARPFTDMLTQRAKKKK